MKLRDGRESDLAYVKSNWLAHAEGCQVAFGMDERLYHARYRALLDKVLKVSHITICCNPEEEDQILGFIVHRHEGDAGVISFLAVKKPFWRIGIAKLMIEHVRRPVTFATHSQDWPEQWAYLRTKMRDIQDQTRTDPPKIDQHALAERFAQMRFGISPHGFLRRMGLVYDPFYDLNLI